jgi:hypothetical protein
LKQLSAPRAVHPKPAGEKTRRIAKETAPEPEFPPAGHDSTGSTAALVGALALVCLGVFSIHPGLGIILAIVLVVPVLRMTILVRERAAAGRSTSIVTRVMIAFGSMVVSWIVMMVVGIVGFGTFCLTCIGTAAATNSGPLSFAAAIGATILAVGVVAIPLTRWIRNRWYGNFED